MSDQDAGQLGQPAPKVPQSDSRPGRNPMSGRSVAGTPTGSFRLFRLFGIDVYMNWTWFIVAYFQIRYHPLHYTTPLWKVAEYLALFGIVLVHEFGHSLACRQVGGIANQIVLWPLGGVAYVSPPPRPGAYLWSVVAGPLVNLILLPITLFLFVLFVGLAGLGQPLSDLQYFIFSITFMNFILLVFNLLPIYPLDGGQIARAMLWFLIGPAHSLMVVALSGIVLGGVGAVFAVLAQRWWLTVLVIFAVIRSITGFQVSRHLMRILKAPKREGFGCPSCGTAPPQGEFWKCPRCQKQFDTFLSNSFCPGCGVNFNVTQCLNCGQAHPIHAWRTVKLNLRDPFNPPPIQTST